MINLIFIFNIMLNENFKKNIMYFELLEVLSYANFSTALYFIITILKSSLNCKALFIHIFLLDEKISIKFATLHCQIHQDKSMYIRYSGLQENFFQKQHFHEAETHIFGHLSGLSPKKVSNIVL